VDGVNQYWICRHVDCLFVGPAVCWIKNGDGGWQFRCPDCMRLYAPWVQSGCRIKAQKCLVLNETGKAVLPIADEKAGRNLYPPFAVRQTILSLNRSASEMMLTEWPNTASEELINVLKAATLDIIDEVKQQVQQQSFEESEEKLLSLLRVHEGETVMTVRDFNAAKRRHLTEYNACHTGVDGGWSWEHLKVNEANQEDKYQYVGFNYKHEEGEHVMTHKELTMMFALSKYCVAARMSQARL
jgi:hypothetical protein